MRRGALLLVAASCLAPGRAAATLQSLAERPDQGFITDPAPHATDEIATTCVTPLRIDATVEIRRPTCRVDRQLPLGARGSRRWHAAVYHRSAFVAWTDPPDSVGFDEIVLFEGGPGTDSLRSAWHIRTERTYEFLSDVRAQPRTEGLLVEFLICLNGTGGCVREYLIDRGAGLEYVRTPFGAALQARLPEGQWLHKGMTLDLETLRGTWPVALPDDPNCCPSRAFDYQVRFEGTDMVLVGATLRASGGDR